MIWLSIPEDPPAAEGGFGGYPPPRDKLLTLYAGRSWRYDGFAEVNLSVFSFPSLAREGELIPCGFALSFIVRWPFGLAHVLYKSVDDMVPEWRPFFFLIDLRFDGHEIGRRRAKAQGWPT